MSERPTVGELRTAQEVCQWLHEVSAGTVHEWANDVATLAGYYAYEYERMDKRKNNE